MNLRQLAAAGTAPPKRRRAGPPSLPTVDAASASDGRSTQGQFACTRSPSACATKTRAGTTVASVTSNGPGSPRHARRPAAAGPGLGPDVTVAQ